jgi:hypothetical protein
MLKNKGIFNLCSEKLDFIPLCDPSGMGLEPTFRSNASVSY